MVLDTGAMESYDSIHFYRSISYKQLQIRNDSLIAKYDDDSKVQIKILRETIREENIYANPFNWRMCYWTGLGIWVALYNEDHMKGNRKLFLSKGEQHGSASMKYWYYPTTPHV